MMMMLYNRNMKISILQIDTEIIITLMNELPHLFDSRILKK